MFNVFNLVVTACLVGGAIAVATYVIYNSSQINNTANNQPSTGGTENAPVIESVVSVEGKDILKTVKPKVGKSKPSVEEKPLTPAVTLPFSPKPLPHLVGVGLRKDHLHLQLCNLFSNIGISMRSYGFLEEEYNEFISFSDKPKNTKPESLVSIQDKLINLAQAILKNNYLQRKDIFELVACCLLPIYAFLPEDEFISFFHFVFDPLIKQDEEELLLTNMRLVSRIFINMSQVNLDSRPFLKGLLEIFNSDYDGCLELYGQLLEPIVLAVQDVCFPQFVKESVAKLFSNGPKPSKPILFTYASLTASTLVKDFDAKTLLGTKMSVKEFVTFMLKEVATKFDKDLVPLERYKGEMGFMAAMTLLPLVSSSAKDMEEVIVSALNPHEPWSVLVIDNLQLLLDVIYTPELIKLPLKRENYKVGAQYCTDSNIVDDFGYVLESVEFEKESTHDLKVNVNNASKGNAKSLGCLKFLLLASKYKKTDELTKLKFEADLEGSYILDKRIKLSESLYDTILKHFN